MDGPREKMNEALREALASRSLRFFHAGSDSVKGHTGSEDARRFAAHLMVLQECSLLLGEKLGMNAPSHAVFHEGDETTGFYCDPTTKTVPSVVTGAIVNRRMPFTTFIGALREEVVS